MWAHGVDKLSDEVQKCKLLIMTSTQNHKETVEFFEQNKYFGGNESSFMFFSQAALPAMDKDGKIIMKQAHEVQLAPNGNGAIFDAINSNQKV